MCSFNDQKKNLHLLSNTEIAGRFSDNYIIRQNWKALTNLSSNKWQFKNFFLTIEPEPLSHVQAGS